VRHLPQPKGLRFLQAPHVSTLKTSSQSWARSEGGPFCRYDIKSAEKVKLREMGPRFTLKLRSLQKGTFDSKLGEYEWIISGRRHDMETSRRKFFL
jgi:hypothetical protein